MQVALDGGALLCFKADHLVPMEAMPSQTFSVPPLSLRISVDLCEYVPSPEQTRGLW
jgi:hypothetical protein